MNHSIPSVCLFCGSRNGKGQHFVAAAQELGTLIANEGWRLVYGAADIGLMGEAARAAKQANGSVFGVMPRHLAELEILRSDLDCLVLTETMHERKKVMYVNSDAIVVLPGGLGTLDEFFEIFAWRQLGLHSKPIFLINVGHYWDGLAGLVETVVETGFADPDVNALFTVVDSPLAAISALRKILSWRTSSIE